MPCTRQDGVLALWTVYGEEIERLVVGIGQANGHHNMSNAYIGKSAKRLLNPKLLKLYLASALLLLFKLDGLLSLVFNGRACAAMLKLDLGAECPTLSKVVAKVDNGMGYVEASVAWVVLSPACRTIAVARVAIEVAAQCHLAVSANA